MTKVSMNGNRHEVCMQSNDAVRSYSASKLVSKVNKICIALLALYAVANVPTADAGIFSGLVTLGTCVGAGILFPGSLFFAAAPCYELTMAVTVNPLLP